MQHGLMTLPSIAWLLLLLLFLVMTVMVKLQTLRVVGV
jgi:hypothetical protein